MSPPVASLDRRIRTILARLAGTTGGEAVASLAALERLLPPSASLADVIFVGLHHLRQDMADPSLVAEVRRLQGELEELARRQHSAERRASRAEALLAKTAADLKDCLALLAAARG